MSYPPAAETRTSECMHGKGQKQTLFLNLNIAKKMHEFVPGQTRTHTHRYTDADADTDTDIHTDTHTQARKHKHTHTHTYTQTQARMH